MYSTAHNPEIGTTLVVITMPDKDKAFLNSIMKLVEAYESRCIECQT